MSNYSYTIFSLLFLASSFVSFFVAYLAWKKKKVRGAKELAMLMLSAGLYSFFVIFETASPNLEFKILWSKLAYIGAVTTPLFYFLFVLRFVGKDKFLTKKNYLLLSIVPFIVFILTITNDYHNLIWTGYSPISPKTNLLEYHHGIGFWIGNVGYNYLLFIIATVYLIRFIITHLADFKSQGKIIFVASMCPWISSIFYISGNNIVPGFDIVPLSMILSGILLAFSIFSSKFLDLVPVARETLFESLKEGFIVLDFNNRVQDINTSAKKQLGILNSNIIGFDFGSLDLKSKPFRNTVMSENPRETIDITEGSVVNYYIIEKHLIANYLGSRLVVIRDYSEDVKREQELLSAIKKADESDKLKSSFLANISHEIRTPLSIIMGFLDVLYTSKVNNEDKELYIRLLKQNSDRILNTLNDIVEVSKIESGQVSLDEGQMNLNEVIDYLYNTYLNKATEKSILLSCVKGLDSKDSLIVIDRLKLTSVMSHLIKNALKFTNNGEVKFGYFLDNNKITFYVEDSGIGIPTERQSVIFNRFIQSEHALTRPYEGTGLGLSIVKAYVSMIGGTISVNSQLDRGSRFYFSINYNPVVFPDNL